MKSAPALDEPGHLSAQGLTTTKGPQPPHYEEAAVILDEPTGRPPQDGEQAMSPKVYAIAQQKGGSGKTVLAADLAWWLAQQDQRVLAIDADPQATLSRRLGWTEDVQVPGTTTDVLAGGMSAEEAAIASPTLPGVDLLVSDAGLADHDEADASVTRWRDHLPSLTRWDAVVIDTSANLKAATLGAVLASHVLAVPAKVAGESIDALVELVEAVHAVGRTVDVVIPNEYDGRRSNAARIVADLAGAFGDRVTPPVRVGVAVQDAYDAGLPTSAYAPSRAVARDLQAVCAIIAATN